MLKLRILSCGNDILSPLFKINTFKETLIKSFAQKGLSDFLSVSSKNRRNTDVLRGFFGLTGGKYANKMCEVIYSVFL